jgi:hypothetical protein
VPPDFAVDCDECGFVYDESRHPAAAAEIRAGSDAIAARLSDLEASAARRRPTPAIWSPVEYAAHVRDVLLVQRERVLEVRRSSRPPHPAPMGRDERVDHDGYADQDPVAVARQLRDAALLLANVLDRLDAGAWSRMLVYNYPEPFERTLRWVAVHTVHEVQHHRLDVERQLTASGGPGGGRGATG